MKTGKSWLQVLRREAERDLELAVQRIGQKGNGESGVIYVELLRKT